MLLGLDFMPPDKIDHMSLNGLRRSVETHDKTQTETQINEPSVALGPLRYHSVNLKAIFCSISGNCVDETLGRGPRGQLYRFINQN
jgi:hypothetical protein